MTALPDYTRRPGAIPGPGQLRRHPIGFAGPGTEPAAFQPLTRREVECLFAYAQTWDMRTAAGQLGCSYQTVKNHFASIRRKLGVETSGGVYIALGWLTIPDNGEYARIRCVASVSELTGRLEAVLDEFRRVQ